LNHRFGRKRLFPLTGAVQKPVKFIGYRGIFGSSSGMPENSLLSAAAHPAVFGKCESRSRPTPIAGEILDNVTQEERIARNEAWCRDLNKRKAEWMRTGQTAASFRCECWRLDCGARIPLSGREWEAVRSQSNRFAVAPEHIADDHEDVAQKYPHFWIVEKRGEAGEVAERLE
jgi:hypothetical protein